MIRTRRVYLPPGPGDGVRVLVDRLWPRGLARKAAAVDLWLREVAPSDALRRWYGHDPARWARFVRRYHAELEARPEAVDRLLALAREGPVTLLFAARDTERNNAVALRAFLEARLRRRPAADPSG
ncbi:DUF488 domain-containing protein [Inmirania thermothiophila]|uniref:Uncharacterized protein YeaO (DUF488 family) n=1 Tax=Inmirania thermothiophila TaxID=1750597 RepID=A0A3N1Y191_9GAMM|nr:DUF488 family protein [Inmirania thermothiophila]ROR32586.1 uncharacterized protein YeaO (DUF488 family) [Inmirania thermothiophila]